MATSACPPPSAMDDDFDPEELLTPEFLAEMRFHASTPAGFNMVLQEILANAYFNPWKYPAAAGVGAGADRPPPEPRPVMPVPVVPSGTNDARRTSAAT